MPKLSTWNDRLVKVEVDIEGTPVSLMVKPHIMTPEDEVTLSQATRGEDQVHAFLDLFCRFVAGWDITDDNEQVIPITPDSLKGTISSRLLMRLFTEASEKAQAAGK